ncbi:hypothetical protein TNCV_3291161 [Trichonephila clavipes]|nr:hypothetical protein TNCV_3291161 [Trichonephila clavipes]
MQVKSVRKFKPPVGVVWKLGEGCQLRFRPRHLTMVQNNEVYPQLDINGEQKKIDELFCLLHYNNVHVACLQETKLNPNLNLKIKGYTELWRDRTKSPLGGLAFLITPTIQYSEVLLSHIRPTNNETEAMQSNWTYLVIQKQPKPTFLEDLETLIQKFISGIQKTAKAYIPRGRRKTIVCPTGEFTT